MGQKLINQNISKIRAKKNPYLSQQHIDNIQQINKNVDYQPTRSNKHLQNTAFNKSRAHTLFKYANLFFQKRQYFELKE